MTRPLAPLLLAVLPALLLLSTLSPGSSLAAGKIPDQEVTVYFGMGRAGGADVTESEWNRFLDEVLIPAFPGFTVLEATGVFRGQRERSKVVTLQLSAAERPRLHEALSEYARRFGQQGVLMVEYGAARRTIVGPNGVIPP